ncbi:MAG: MFS transporter [Clostridiales bacterium]|jgi:MFS family permease|nr:MFS transporter [Clostridiales bacterium]
MKRKPRRAASDDNSLIGVLKNLRGNSRACVLTEPLWTIPSNLYTPYFTLYMYSLNVRDGQIGLLLAVGLFLQLLTSLAGGVLIDKFGRRRVTFITDLVAWSLPCFIWAVSQDFNWFLAAAILNSFDQISAASWQCLLVEDTEAEKIVHIYNWCQIGGLLAVFFAPVSGLLIGRFSLIPVMRGLFIFSFLSMTAKFIILYLYSTETRQGVVRMAETRGKPLLSLFAEYGAVFKRAAANPATVRALALSALSYICGMVTGNFFSIYITQDLNIPETYIAWFPIARAAVMLIFFFGAQKIFARWKMKPAMITGIGLFCAAHALLIAARFGAGGGMALLPVLFVYSVLDACATALFFPRKDAIVILDMEPAERARTLSLIFMITLGVSSPFGYLAGLLSEIDRRLPFLLNLVLFAAMLWIVGSAKEEKTEKAAVDY